MGFDLWRTLGVTPTAGLAMAAAGILFAGLLALRMFLRDRRAARHERGLGLAEVPRRDPRS